MKENGFCIYINTVCDGPVPVYRNAQGKPYVYKTELEAQREIADDLITQLEQFMAGEREFEDAMTVEEYVMSVEAFPDGSIVDENGNCFGKDSEV